MDRWNKGDTGKYPSLFRSPGGSLRGMVTALAAVTSLSDPFMSEAGTYSPSPHHPSPGTRRGRPACSKPALLAWPGRSL